MFDVPSRSVRVFLLASEAVGTEFLEKGNSVKLMFTEENPACLDSRNHHSTPGLFVDIFTLKWWGRQQAIRLLENSITKSTTCPLLSTNFVKNFGNAYIMVRTSEFHFFFL
jgi:hypothetical protein